MPASLKLQRALLGASVRALPVGLGTRAFHASVACTEAKRGAHSDPVSAGAEDDRAEPRKEKRTTKRLIDRTEKVLDIASELLVDERNEGAAKPAGSELRNSGPDRVAVRTTEDGSSWKVVPESRSRRNSGRAKLSEEILRRNDPEANPPVNEAEIAKNDRHLEHQLSLKRAAGARIEEIQPGDFVEVRRTGKVLAGVVLPITEEYGLSDSNRENSLSLVVASGVLEVVRPTDVMLQFPGFVEAKMAYAAAPLKREYVLASLSKAAAEPTDMSESMSTANDEFFKSLFHSEEAKTHSVPSAMAQEPFDLKRFSTRAAICQKIRYLQRETDREIRRIFPAFRTLFLQEQIGNALHWNTKKEKKKVGSKELQYLQRGLDLLHRGSITTLEAAALIDELAASQNKSKSEMKGLPDTFKAQTIFATHILLMNHPYQFIADATSHRQSQLFTYRSAEEQSILSRVSSWVREATMQDVKNASKPSSEAERNLSGFCARAQHIIRWSEALSHANTTAFGETYCPDEPGKIEALPDRVPSLDGSGPLEWTAADRDIINFLKISIGNRRELQDDQAGSYAMAILKLVGAHTHLVPSVYAPMEHIKRKDEDRMKPVQEILQKQKMTPVLDTKTDIAVAGPDLQHALIFNFLVRIGAIAPWENPNALDTFLRNHEGDTDRVFAERDEITSTSTNESEAADRVAQRWDLNLEYEEEKHRDDFGSTPVYVIDAPTAHELDDGISVQPVQQKGQYWIHVHIADPSAWISPTSPLAKHAEQRYLSIYFPEERWPLLPHEVTTDRMSLLQSSDQLNHDGQRVVTFSARVDTQNGKVQDYRVGLNRVHNVNVLNYDEVNAFFKDKAVPANSHEALKKKQAQDDLLLIAGIMSSLHRRRCQVGGAINAYQYPFDFELSPIPLPSLASELPAHPRFFRGIPNIQLQVGALDGNFYEKGTLDGLPGGMSSETMVSEAMILAGRISASFGVEHGLPLPFRLQRPPEASQLPLIQKMKHPLTGAVSISDLQENEIYLPSGYYSSSPGAHFALGVKPMSGSNRESDALYHGGYARVTSPLRRFPDLLAHWQVKAALTDKAVPWDPIAVETQLPRFERMDAWASQLEKSARRYWVWAYCAQLLHKKAMLESSPETGITSLSTFEQKLLEPMQAIVNNTDVRLDLDTLEANIRANLSAFRSLPVNVRWDPKAPPPTQGQKIQVKLQKAIAAGAKRTLVFQQE